jgi:hypothetical protein
VPVDLPLYSDGRLDYDEIKQNGTTEDLQSSRQKQTQRQEWRQVRLVSRGIVVRTAARPAAGSKDHMPKAHARAMESICWQHVGEDRLRHMFIGAL